MKKRNQYLAGLLVLSLAGMLLGGCQNEAEPPAATDGAGNAAQDGQTQVPTDSDDKGYTFALIPKTLNNPFFVGMRDAAQKKADELGVTLEVIAPPQESDIDQQISMFESMLEKGVDGIMVVPCGTKEIVSSIERAHEMNIPVITVDTNAEGGEPLCFIGTDNYAGGVLAAEWIGKTYQKGEIAFLTGTPGNLTHEDRLRGCRETLEEKYPNIKVMGDALPTYSDRAQAMSQTENLLTAYPDLTAIYCVNDEIGLGASEAIAAAGKTDKVAVIGYDGSPEASQAILDGRITATLAQQPGKMGALAVESMYRYLKDGTQPEAFTATECNVVTKDNASEYLEWH